MKKTFQAFIFEMTIVLLFILFSLKKKNQQAVAA